MGNCCSSPDKLDKEPEVKSVEINYNKWIIVEMIWSIWIFSYFDAIYQKLKIVNLLFETCNFVWFCQSVYENTTTLIGGSHTKSASLNNKSEVILNH